MNDLYNLDWKKYNKLVYDSISFEYFPKEDPEFKSEICFECLELREEKIIYIPIGKNASTSITNSLNCAPIGFPLPPDSKFHIEHIDIPKKYKNEYKFLIITRDPKQRWISGINEFLNNNRYKVDFDGNEKGSRNKFLMELKNNKFIFDYHTMTQLSYVSFCFKQNLNLLCLKLDENLNEKISNILKKPVLISQDNSIKKYKYKLKNFKFCYDVLTRYCMQNKNFLQLHEMDFCLYNNSV